MAQYHESTFDKLFSHSELLFIGILLLLSVNAPLLRQRFCFFCVKVPEMKITKYLEIWKCKFFSPIVPGYAIPHNFTETENKDSFLVL